MLAGEELVLVDDSDEEMDQDEEERKMQVNELFSDDDDDDDDGDPMDKHGWGAGKKKRKRDNSSKGEGGEGGDETAEEMKKKAKKKKAKKNKHRKVYVHRKAFEAAWLSCLRLPMAEEAYERVLLNLPEHVMPHLLHPLSLADFLSQSFSVGGLTSVLALSGLFILIQCHNLDYPDFFQSLYEIIEPSIFYAKHRARFFRLLDMCLTSSLLPSYVIASFIKK